MTDLIDLLLTCAADPTLRQAVADHAAALAALERRGDRRLVVAAERAVAADPAAAFAFAPDGSATLTAAGHARRAGRFEAVSIGTLRDRCRALGPAAGRVTVSVLDGAVPVADVAAFQATSGGDTLFQVASQFNCLESPGPTLSPVADYFHDFTQGPRASASAFPATLLRHYAAPAADGRRFVQQTNGPQIDLLADALGPGHAPNGYLNGTGVRDPAAVANTLAERFDHVRVGLHAGAEVVLGGNWDGGVPPRPDGRPRTIAQAFTSTVAGGGYGGERFFGPYFAAVAGHLLRAAYLGTLLGAGSLGCRRVVLTLIGGGVFANPLPLILDAIDWAVTEASAVLPQPTDIVVNGWTLCEQVGVDAVLPLARAHGGAVFHLGRSGSVHVRR